MKKGILFSAIALFLLVGAARAEAVRARIHINTHLVVQHHGSSDYTAWGSPAEYEAQILEVLHDMLQAKGIARVDVNEDFIITVDKMELRESTKKRSVKDPNRPGVTAHAFVATIRVRLAGSILNKHTGERKSWKRMVAKSEDVQFQPRPGQSRPRLKKDKLAPNICARLSRKTARKAAKRISRKIERMN